MGVMGMTVDRDRDFRRAIERIVHVDSCELPIEGPDACPTCTPIYELDGAATKPIGGLGLAIQLGRETLQRWPEEVLHG